MRVALLALVVVAVLFALHVYNDRYVSVRASDGVVYNVLAKFADHGAAAALLYSLNSDVMRLLRRLKNKYHIDETDDMIAREGAAHLATGDARNIVGSMLLNYNPEVIWENDPSNILKDTSYNINKGDKIMLCLRQGGPPYALVERNTVMFVLLHEISHTAAYDVWNHPTRFWAVFKFVLSEAVQFGIYTPIDYAATPKKYCGLEITYQPLGDNTLPSIGP